MGTPAKETTSQITYLARTMKTPAPARSRRPAGRTCQGRNLDAPGVPLRGHIPRSRPRRGLRRRGQDQGRPVPARKSLDEFTFEHLPTLNQDLIAHLGTLAFISKGENVVLLGRHRRQGRPTWESGWEYARRRPGTGCSSLRPQTGSTGSKAPTARADCRRSWRNGAATQS